MPPFSDTQVVLTCENTSMLDMEHARFRMLHDSLKKAPLPIKQRWLPTLLYTQACHIINKTIFLFCRVSVRATFQLRRSFQLENHPQLVLGTVDRQFSLQALPSYEFVVELGQKSLEEHNHLKFSELSPGTHVPAAAKHRRKRLLLYRHRTRTGRGRCARALAVVSVQESEWAEPGRETRA